MFQGISNRCVGLNAARARAREQRLLLPMALDSMSSCFGTRSRDPASSRAQLGPKLELRKPMALEPISLWVGQYPGGNCPSRKKSGWALGNVKVASVQVGTDTKQPIHGTNLANDISLAR